MGYAEEAMAQLHGQNSFSTGVTQETDWKRELERRGKEIADAMGRYRGTEPLVEAVKRLADDYHNASTRGYVTRHVETELARARETHAPMNSHHEGYAVILEELDELWEVCKMNTHSFAKTGAENQSLRDAKKARMREEAIQIATMAIRFVEDICDK